MSTTTLLLQLIVILGTARVCGWVLRRGSSAATQGS